MQNTIDCFCVDCGVNRVFEIINDTPDYSLRGIQYMNDEVDICNRNIFDNLHDTLFNSYLGKRYTLTYYCTRNREHSIFFDLFITDKKK